MNTKLRLAIRKNICRPQVHLYHKTKTLQNQLIMKILNRLIRKAQNKTNAFKN